MVNGGLPGYNSHDSSNSRDYRLVVEVNQTTIYSAYKPVMTGLGAQVIVIIPAAVCGPAAAAATATATADAAVLCGAASKQSLTSDTLRANQRLLHEQRQPL